VAKHTSGAAIVSGYDIVKEAEGIANIGLIFQALTGYDFYQSPSLSVIIHIAFSERLS
jgi:hypothetical protein